jgi:anti-anti-sigma regulatory factor
MASQTDPVLLVDLTGVTFIDEAGKACLAALHRRGAEFVAIDCMTKAILDEIAQSTEQVESDPIIGSAGGERE